MECISAGRTLYYASDDKSNMRRGWLVLGGYTKAWKEAERLNSEKYGIHWSVNEFDGPRQIVALKRIKSWAVDFDDCNKVEQRAKIRAFGLTPSLVIESARGYQVYYDAIDATPENYNSILKAMSKKLGSDPAAVSVTRTLRAPFFNHWKDPNKPFAVRVIRVEDIAYSEKDMLKFFSVEKEKPIQYQPIKKTVYGSSRVEKLESIGALEGLRRLSGTTFVRGQVFTFQRVSKGHYNILVDNKSSNAFIDSRGMIGSASGGGPTILQWLQYPDYGHSKDQAWEIITSIFPEVFGKD